jgi:hypothetical protein
VDFGAHFTLYISNSSTPIAKMKVIIFQVDGSSVQRQQILLILNVQMAIITHEILCQFSRKSQPKSTAPELINYSVNADAGDETCHLPQRRNSHSKQQIPLRKSKKDDGDPTHAAEVRKAVRNIADLANSTRRRQELAAEPRLAIASPNLTRCDLT